MSEELFLKYQLAPPDLRMGAHLLLLGFLAPEMRGPEIVSMGLVMESADRHARIIKHKEDGNE